MESLSNSDGTVLNLVELKDFDDYTYTHSINVCLVAMLFAKRLSYNAKGIKIIGISALLHDLGKLIVPKEILNKPFKLTADEFDIMKKHPVYSYEYIKSQSSYGPLIQKAVLLHHEKYTGKGYPFGFRGEQIGEIAQIISIADVFDASRANGATNRPPVLVRPEHDQEDERCGVCARLAMTFVQTCPFLTEADLSKGQFRASQYGRSGRVVDYKFPRRSNRREIYINSRIMCAIPSGESRIRRFAPDRERIRDETMIGRLKVSRSVSRRRTSSRRAPWRPSPNPYRRPSQGSRTQRTGARTGTGRFRGFFEDIVKKDKICSSPMRRFEITLYSTICSNSFDLYGFEKKGRITCPFFYCSILRTSIVPLHILCLTTLPVTVITSPSRALTSETRSPVTT